MKLKRRLKAFAEGRCWRQFLSFGRRPRPLPRLELLCGGCSVPEYMYRMCSRLESAGVLEDLSRRQLKQIKKT